MAIKATTHFKVPKTREDRDVCLGPDGAAARIIRVVRMIQGRWKLPIMFRLYASTTMRTSELRRDLPGISQKMLTQHLRELEADQLIERLCSSGRPLHVEYQLSTRGRRVLSAFGEVRNASNELTG